MTALERLSAIQSIAVRDATLFFAHRFRALSQTLMALLSVTLFYYVSRLVDVERFPTPDAYFAFVVVGLVILQALTATLASVPASVRTELVAGTFERLATSPLGPEWSIAGMMVFPAALSLLTGGVTILLAAVIFGLPLAGWSAMLAVPAGVLAVLAFIPFALLISAAVLMSKQAGNVSRIIVIALSLVGGVYFPPELLPGWTHWMTSAQPFTPALELLRETLLASEPGSPAVGDVLRLVAFATVALPIGFAALRLATNSCRRRGTLIEA